MQIRVQSTMFTSMKRNLLFKARIRFRSRWNDLHFREPVLTIWSVCLCATAFACVDVRSYTEILRWLTCPVVSLAFIMEYIIKRSSLKHSLNVVVCLFIAISLSQNAADFLYFTFKYLFKYKMCSFLKIENNSSWVNFIHFREKKHLLAFELIFVSSSLQGYVDMKFDI